MQAAGLYQMPLDIGRWDYTTDLAECLVGVEGRLPGEQEIILKTFT